MTGTWPAMDWDFVWVISNRGQPGRLTAGEWQTIRDRSWICWIISSLTQGRAVISGDDTTLKFRGHVPRCSYTWACFRKIILTPSCEGIILKSQHIYIFSLWKIVSCFSFHASWWLLLDLIFFFLVNVKANTSLLANLCYVRRWKQSSVSTDSSPFPLLSALPLHWLIVHVRRWILPGFLFEYATKMVWICLLDAGQLMLGVFINYTEHYKL